MQDISRALTAIIIGLFIYITVKYRYNRELDIFQPRQSLYTYERIMMIEDPSETMKQFSKRDH